MMTWKAVYKYLQFRFLRELLNGYALVMMHYPESPGFQFQSKFPIEKILPDFHQIPGYLDPRLICLAWPLGEPSPVSVRRFVFILPSFGVSHFTILFNTSITPNRLRAWDVAGNGGGGQRHVARKCLGWMRVELLVLTPEGIHI